VYNVIRVFVSAYVWMTGFGNFLYFEKAQDFSIDRAVSMWLRINYFPLLLSFGLSVSLENYYVVPLHTAAFFVTMATCKVASILKNKGWDDYWQRNGAAIALCFVVHIVFYETRLVESLRFFSDEYYFRFQADKYTAIVGILSGYVWAKFKAYMQWAYAGEQPQVAAMWAQRIGGASLIYIWWALFGHINDKYTYNPIHPYCFWLPVAGWLMLRNSSKYLCELHSEALEFFGRITLETYVLQFHVYMNHNVKNIPVILPGSGEDGIWIMKFLNMGLCGVLFVTMAYYARKITITTQTTVHELLLEIKKGGSGQAEHRDDANDELEKFVPTGKESNGEGVTIVKV
jgi:N-acetylneuraminate 9-O-acetyltransferase